MFVIPEQEEKYQLRLLSGAQGEEGAALTLLFALRGETALSVAGLEQTRLTPDLPALIADGVPFRTGPAREGDLLQLRFGLCRCAAPGFTVSDLKKTSPAFAELLLSQRQVLRFRDAHTLLAGAIRCASACAGLDERARKAALSIVSAYILLLAADAVQAEAVNLHAGNCHVRKALKYMHDHFTQSIRADDIARAVGIHPGHLHRLFYEQTGKRVNEYLVSLRMEKAKLLLIGSSLSVTDISAAVGMSSQQYFNRVFKAYAGVTPQGFRGVFNITCDYSKAVRQYYTETCPTIGPERA